MMIFSEFFMHTFLADATMKYSIHCSHTTLQRCDPTKNVCWALCLEKLLFFSDFLKECITLTRVETPFLQRFLQVFAV